MLKSPSLRARFGRAVAAGAAAAVGVVSVLGGSPAASDPKQFTALVGVGSDTTQDVLNALAGHAGGRNYVPIQSATPARQQVISFDAIPPGGVTDPCIATRVRMPTMWRPNGSTQGMRALSRAIDGAGYGDPACGGVRPVAGLVDFARSSSGPPAGDTGTALTYVPFGRDAVSFGFFRASGGAPVTNLTRAQLTALFRDGPQTIDGVRIVPCGIQTGSGTHSFWLRANGVTAAQEAAATAECNRLEGVADPTGRVQENHGAELREKGTRVPAGQQVVVGFSAANFISQTNGVADSDLVPGVGLGAIDGQIPFSGTAPNLTPRAEFYNDATFGRHVFNVFPTTVIDHTFLHADVRSLFRGPGAVICQPAAQATVNAFGFLSVTDCGSTALKGALRTGTR